MSKKNLVWISSGIAILVGDILLCLVFAWSSGTFLFVFVAGMAIVAYWLREPGNAAPVSTDVNPSLPPSPTSVTPSAAETAGRTVGNLKRGPAGFGMAGAAIGFAVGYLTRPSILGQKLNLAALYNPAYAPSTDVQSDFRLHMLVATVIGFLIAFVLRQMMLAAKR